eukprot:jgi/Ulvmu1/6057/UM027_0035.1
MFDKRFRWRVSRYHLERASHVDSVSASGLSPSCSKVSHHYGTSKIELWQQGSDTVSGSQITRMALQMASRKCLHVALWPQIQTITLTDTFRMCVTHDLPVVSSISARPAHSLVIGWHAGTLQPGLAASAVDQVTHTDIHAAASSARPHYCKFSRGPMGYKRWPVSRAYRCRRQYNMNLSPGPQLPCCHLRCVADGVHLCLACVQEGTIVSTAVRAECIAALPGVRRPACESVCLLTWTAEGTRRRHTRVHDPRRLGETMSSCFEDCSPL